MVDDGLLPLPLLITLLSMWLTIWPPFNDNPMPLSVIVDRVTEIVQQTRPIPNLDYYGRLWIPVRRRALFLQDSPPTGR
jgi:hypothetical protein